MKVFTDDAHVRRKTRIAQAANLVGLVVLGSGLVISLVRPQWAIYTLALLIVGVIASQYGIVQAYRYARKPRPDEELADNLKGLDDRYRLYNFVGPVKHILATPRGIFAIAMRGLDGRIECEGTDCRQIKSFSLGRLLRLFSPEYMGSPIRDALVGKETLAKWLQERAPSAAEAAGGLVVLLSPKAELEAKNTAVPVIRAKGLKEFLRRGDRKPISAEALRAAMRALDELAAGSSGTVTK